MTSIPNHVRKNCTLPISEECLYISKIWLNWQKHCGICRPICWFNCHAVAVTGCSSLWTYVENTAIQIHVYHSPYHKESLLTCWAINEYWINNKISGIKLVFSLYATIKMMHGPINLRLNESIAWCNRPGSSQSTVRMTIFPSVSAMALCLHKMWSHIWEMWPLQQNRVVTTTGNGQLNGRW